MNIKRIIGFSLLFFILFSLIFSNIGSVSAASLDCKLYKKYKKEYSNKKDKKYYSRIKEIKSKNLALYAEYRSTYEKYKKYKKKDFKKLSKSIQKTFKVYESYRGYKDFRYYKDKCQGLNPEDDSYDVIYQSSGHGYISGEPNQRVKEGTNSTTVTAVPDAGFHFVGWNDGLTSASRSEINVLTSMTLTANFFVNSYALNYTAGAGGTISGFVNQTVNYGSNGATVTAVPASGYRFIGWSDGVSAAIRTDSRVTGDVSVTANFVANTYTLSYTAGAHGSISGSTSQTVNHGENGSQVTAVPDAGYRFVRWSDNNTNASRTDSNVTGNISVSAVFESDSGITTYTLTYTAGEGGSITGTSPQTVNAGEDGSQVTAVPDTGYHFVSWSDASTENPRTDEDVAGNITVTASFAANTYTVTFDGNTSDGGSTATQTLTYNTPTALTANGYTKTGYTFAGWATTAEGEVAYADTASFTIGASNITLYAKWTINTYTVTFNKNEGDTEANPTTKTATYNGNVGTLPTAPTRTNYSFNGWNTASNGEGTSFDATTAVTANITVYAQWTINSYTLTYTAGSNGTITGISPQTVNHGSDGSQVTAVPDSGYHFTSWSDGVLTASRTDTNVTGNISVTASFEADAPSTYTLTYTAGEGGSITGTSPQTVNAGEDGSQVTAVPDTGRHFTSWSDGVLTASRTDVDVSEDITVTANFAINTYTLIYTAGTGGTISGITSQTVNFGANGTTVTAIADSGYHFVEWSDHVTTEERTDLNISANLSVSAVFEANSVVTVTAIDPTSGYNTDSVDLTSITGTGFLSGATVKLTKSGQSDVPCTGFTVASSTSITGGACHIAGAQAGVWSVVVTNPDTGSGTLTDAFTVQEYTIGSVGPAGGYIFYINPLYDPESADNNWKYLEAAPSDQHAGIDWWDDYGTLMGASGTAVGTGLSNTNTVIGSSTPGNTSSIAIAYNYSLNGYTDWFLPSINELNLMYDNLHSPDAKTAEGVGVTYGFSSVGYWSSTEESSSTAQRRSFGTTSSALDPRTKDKFYRVRAARRFSTTATYDIIYNGNGSTGGTVPTDSNHYPSGSVAIALGEGTLVKDGHKFMGWNTAADGSGTTYQDGDNLTLGSADVILYAIWEVDFYVAVFPDTQSAVNWKPSVLTSQVDWLINNKNILDIRFIGHVGDLVASWERDLTEWSFIQNELARLKTAGLPFSTLPGNHDYTWMTRDNTLLNSYFPLSNFTDMATYGGAYNTDSDNTYHILNVGGKQLLILSLEFGPRDAVVAWANGILQAHSDKKAIVITHAYINTDGDLLASGMDHAATNYGLGSDVNNGDDLWNDLIYPNNNIAFVICGHDGTETDGSGLRESTHANGAPVHQFLTNYQYYSPVANGSYLFLLHFSADTVEVRTYSPYLNAYKNDSESQQDYAWSF